MDFVDTEHGWLGASPAGLIYDPSNVDYTDGVLEIKCPYSMRTKRSLKLHRCLASTVNGRMASCT